MTSFLRLRKKAIMGVSTLIIFITAILVAAVAASVVVRTVGVLQERAFTVGTEVRDRLVTALDIISVTAYNNVSEQRVYGLTMLVRTRAGSYAYDLTSMGLIFTSGRGTFTAKLQHTENDDLGFEVASINNVTTTAILDMDEDRVPESVILMSSDNNEQLRFLFSRHNEYAYADLGVNISDAAPGNAINITVDDVPIISETGRWYGFVHIDGVTESPTSIGAAATVTITRYPLRDFCTFERLIPETAFCFDVQLGLGDTAISRGEIYRLYYRFRPQNHLRTDESFQIQFIPEKGDITSVIGKTPDSLRRESGEIWPTTLET